MCIFNIVIEVWGFVIKQIQPDLHFFPGPTKAS